MRSPGYSALLVRLLTVTALTGVVIGWSQPDGDSSLQIVGRGVISTEAPEFATSLTPDGREIYFNRASADRSTLRIMTARRTSDGGWTTPVVAPFSGEHRDVDPFVAPDGRRLYFSSDRPRRAGTEPRFATWYVERSGDGWGAPIDPGAPLNSEAGEVFVSVTGEGLVLFSSNRAGPPRIFSARQAAGRWETPRPVTFGTVVDAGNPAIAPSGRFAVLVRAPAGGAAELHASCRNGDGWAEPHTLAPAVNSPFADFAPSIDAAERFLYFTSERPGVAGPVSGGTRPPGDLYRIGLVEAGIRCP